MCRVLEFAERTFYAAKARPPAARTVTDEAHKTVITAEWKANYSCYGRAGCTNISAVKGIGSRVARSPG